ncbi:CinA family protein [Pedococcus soli]
MTGAGSAADVVAALRAAGTTVATAESLTGGLVAAALTDVPGASAVVRGGVVSYATDVKASVLGVDPAVLAEGGAVQDRVAREMALGVARVCGADLGVATTGVAGPDPQDGRPVGTVFVAVARAGQELDRVEVRELALTGDRAGIRAATVAAALALVSEIMGRSADVDGASGWTRGVGGAEDSGRARR